MIPLAVVRIAGSQEEAYSYLEKPYQPYHKEAGSNLNLNNLAQENCCSFATMNAPALKHKLNAGVQ